MVRFPDQVMMKTFLIILCYSYYVSRTVWQLCFPYYYLHSIRYVWLLLFRLYQMEFCKPFIINNYVLIMCVTSKEEQKHSNSLLHARNAEKIVFEFEQGSFWHLGFLHCLYTHCILLIKLL